MLEEQREEDLQRQKTLKNLENTQRLLQNQNVSLSPPKPKKEPEEVMLEDSLNSKAGNSLKLADSEDEKE